MYTHKHTYKLTRRLEKLDHKKIDKTKNEPKYQKGKEQITPQLIV